MYHKDGDDVRDERHDDDTSQLADGDVDLNVGGGRLDARVVRLLDEAGQVIYFQREVLIEDTFHLVVKRVDAIGKALGRLCQRSRLRTRREAGRAEGVLQAPCPVRKPTQRILHVAPICQLAAHVLLEVWVAHLIYGDVEVLVLQKLPELLRGVSGGQGVGIEAGLGLCGPTPLEQSRVGG